MKLSTRPGPADLARLRKAADRVGAARRFLVSRTTEPVTQGDTWSCRPEHLLGALRGE